MLTYVYTAKDIKSGQTVKAEVQAESEQSAAKLLIDQELAPISIKLKGEDGLQLPFVNRIKTKERIMFTRQLSTLISAGLPLTQSLRTVMEQIENKRLLNIVNGIITDIEGGSSLADAFSKYPDVFDTIYINLIRAGETSGSLDKTLERIADQQEKDAAVTSKIRGAMVYPAIVLFVVVGVVIFLLTTVMPQLETLYQDMDAELPLITTMLLGVANFINAFWWLVIIALGVGIYLLHHYLKTDQGRQLIDRLKVKVPLFGSLFMRLYMTRFCRTAGTLLSSGVPMLESLNITKKAINNIHIEREVEEAAKQVKAGKPLSTPLEDNPWFLSLVPQMIKIGEQSGSISDMLMKTAAYFEEELDQQIKNLSTTIEPILMVVMGVVVGLIVAAILVPTYGLIDLSI